MDLNAIIIRPVVSEAALAKIERNNELVFIVDRGASRPIIKRAFEVLYNVKVEKVNTCITPRGEKKAYIKLSPEHKASDLASKLGLL
ncbi:MAG: 50S ribosomal protein L23 [Candidatus Nezhaarchaeota archaeon]|nr:50S ribosomal protein L23 [Candidatus Nezhaarchaeota archaeon]